MTTSRTPILPGEIDWRALMEQTDPDLHKRDIEYQFSNGRVFYEPIPGGNLYAPDPEPEA